MKQESKVAIATLLSKSTTLHTIKNRTVHSHLAPIHQQPHTHLLHTNAHADLFCNLSFSIISQGRLYHFSKQSFCRTNKAIVNLPGFQRAQIAFPRWYFSRQYMQRDGCWNCPWLCLCPCSCKDPRPWTAARARGGEQVKNVPVCTHSILPTPSAPSSINTLGERSTFTLNKHNNSVTNNSANNKKETIRNGRKLRFFFRSLYLYLFL